GPALARRAAAGRAPGPGRLRNRDCVADPAAARPAGRPSGARPAAHAPARTRLDRGARPRRRRARRSRARQGGATARGAWAPRRQNGPRCEGRAHGCEHRRRHDLVRRGDAAAALLTARPAPRAPAASGSRAPPALARARRVRLRRAAPRACACAPRRPRRRQEGVRRAGLSRLGHTQGVAATRKDTPAARWREVRYAGAPERVGEVFSTISGVEVEPLYTGESSPVDEERELGFPGEFPFTRGVYPSMYRGRLWTMRQFAGFGKA